MNVSLYVYQKDAKNKIELLFPNSYYRTSQIDKGDKKYLPSENRVYTLDNTVGKENFYFIFSKESLHDTEINFSSNSDMDMTPLGISKIEEIQKSKSSRTLISVRKFEKILKSISNKSNSYLYKRGVIHK